MALTRDFKETVKRRSAELFFAEKNYSAGGAIKVERILPYSAVRESGIA